MESTKTIKLTAFVDESGQDTEGEIFVVTIVVLENEKQGLANMLDRIEVESGKRNVKWHKAGHSVRKDYMERLLAEKDIRGVVFVDVFRDTKEYIELTSNATAKAVLKKAGRRGYKAAIFVDGLKRKEVETFSRGLRDLCT